VSRLVGLTRERVRQIEKEAIERLVAELGSQGSPLTRSKRSI
jgi:DNA-directed RNA polymerase sigma subunit (sigma70/sigma32)